MSLVRTGIIAAAILFASSALGQEPSSVPQPTDGDVRYGAHERNVLDFWQAESPNPTPLVVYFHPGGYTGLSKERIREDNAAHGSSLTNTEILRGLLRAGISVAAINYRLIQHAPLPAAHTDARRALQFLRSKAVEWRIDKSRVGLYGSSVGGEMATWLAFHDEMADQGSSDPIAHESTRVLGAASLGGMVTRDYAWWVEWIPGYEEPHRDVTEDFGIQDAGELKRRLEEISPLAQLSADDPPFFMNYAMHPDDPVPSGEALGWKAHHVIFGIKFKEKADALGVEAHLRFPGQEPTYNSVVRFFEAKLLGT